MRERSARKVAFVRAMLRLGRGEPTRRALSRADWPSFQAARAILAIDAAAEMYVVPST